MSGLLVGFLGTSPIASTALGIVNLRSRSLCDFWTSGWYTFWAVDCCSCWGLPKLRRGPICRPRFPDFRKRVYIRINRGRGIAIEACSVYWEALVTDLKVLN